MELRKRAKRWVAREEDGKRRGTRRSEESKSREDVLHAREHMLGGRAKRKEEGFASYRKPSRNLARDRTSMRVPHAFHRLPQFHLVVASRARGANVAHGAQACRETPPPTIPLFEVVLEVAAAVSVVAEDGSVENRGVSPAMHPEKRPRYAQRHDKVILLHDNARPHVAKPVKTYLETLKWEVLPHPLYSPDIAPSDFHVFRSMAHGLADRRFHSYEEAQKWIDSWIASKDMSFFRRGIHVLPERWEKVVSSDGQYFK
ncbi:MOS1T transposase, partial [Pseudoatta argentina]